MSITTNDVATYLRLLEQLIAIPSFSTEESDTADTLEAFLEKAGHHVSRTHNNVIARYTHFDENRPNMLLCSHHDTVRPNLGYTRDPFHAEVQGDKLYGLGSNDAGGPLIALLAAFDILSGEELPFNLIFIAAAEEEITGAKGVASVLDQLKNVHFGIIGEPTGLKVATAEKGLLVIDAVTKGVAGHAAHHQDIHSIHVAAEEIRKLAAFQFEKATSRLGSTKATVSQIHAGKQHNQVPAECTYVIDVRVNECYTNEEVFRILQDLLTESHLNARSFRLQSSSIPLEHPMVMLVRDLGFVTYGSPTLSDQAVMPFPTIKFGPGLSERSHSADEFIYISEIEEGIKTYISLLTQYNPSS